MAFEKTTVNELGKAFDVNFLYAFILATFLLFNGLAFSDYIYFNANNKVGFFINTDADAFDVAFNICHDEINTIDLILNEDLNCELIAEKESINSELNNDLNNELINNKTLIKSELKEQLNPELNNNIAVINSESNNDLINNKVINSDFNSNRRPTAVSAYYTPQYTPPVTSTTYITRPTQNKQVNTIPSNYNAHSYSTSRATNVNNTTQQQSITYTSRTNDQAPQNKTFIKSTKDLQTTSKIDLDNLDEVSFLLADLIETANEQGKNIILSFGAKWCLPCKQMEKNVYKNLEVNGAIYKDYVFQKLDEKDFETITLKNLYDVKVYPTTLILDNNGNVIQKYEEGLSKNRMMTILAENTYRPTSDEAIAKVDSSSQPIDLEAAIEFLVSRAENSTLGFD